MSPLQNIRRSWYALAGASLLALTACGPGMAPVGVEIAVRRPPPDRVEVVGVAPGPGYAWIRGHYAWQGGDYAWIGGRWEAPPAPGRHWQQGHYARARGGYYWVEGRWR